MLKKPMLQDVINNRDIYIFGNKYEAQNALINLFLGGQKPIKYIHVADVGSYIGDNPIEDWKQIIGKTDSSYNIIADNQNNELISQLLQKAGFEPYIDFVSIKPASYKKFGMIVLNKVYINLVLYKIIFIASQQYHLLF